MTDQQALDILKTEGYGNINVVSFEPDHRHPEHTHDRWTLQIITKGELTVIDKDGPTNHYAMGGRLESPPGTTHSAIAGPEGCTFAVGMK